MVSFIYFDVGGVVIKDFSSSNKWDLLRNDLGIKPSDKEKFSAFWIEYEKEICTTTPVDEIIPLLEKKFDVSIPSNYSLLDNFVRYFEKNQWISPVIEEISKSCEIGLLTSMYVGMFNEIVRADILPHVLWNTIIDSSIVGYAKPDKKIFEIAQEEAHVAPENILLIENNRNNIDVAKSLRWQTFFYDSADYENSSKKLHYFLQRVVSKDDKE